MNENNDRYRGSAGGSESRLGWAHRKTGLSAVHGILPLTHPNRSHRKAVRLLIYPLLRHSRRVGA